MIVYGSSLSPFVRKVLVICAEKGIEVENRVAGPGAPPPEGFLDASPFRKIPAIRDGDFVLADSSAIAHYLEAAHPDPRLIPAEPRARGRAVWFDEFADTIVFASGVKIFFNRVVGPLVGLPHDIAVAEKAEAEEAPAQLAYLEQVAPETGWLVGEDFSLADAAVGSVFGNFKLAGCKVCEERYPRLSAYLARAHARPSLKSILESNHAFLDSVKDRLHLAA